MRGVLHPSPMTAEIPQAPPDEETQKEQHASPTADRGYLIPDPREKSVKREESISQPKHTIIEQLKQKKHQQC